MARFAYGAMKSEGLSEGVSSLRTSRSQFKTKSYPFLNPLNFNTISSFRSYNSDL
jgi:hypothetical protein